MASNYASADSSAIDYNQLLSNMNSIDSLHSILGQGSSFMHDVPTFTAIPNRPHSNVPVESSSSIGNNVGNLSNVSLLSGGMFPGFPGIVPNLHNQPTVVEESPPKDIFEACKEGDTERVSFLIKSGVDINCRDDAGHTLVHWAAIAGYIDILNLLLEKSTDVSLPEKSFQQTPLHWAITKGQYRAAHWLLQNGADPEAADYKGCRPIHYCSQYGQPFLAHLLICHGANPTSLDFDGRSPLHWASYMDFPHVIRIALAKGNQLDLADSGGMTALHWAATKGHSITAKLIFDYGASPSMEDIKGCTPAMLAKEKGHLSLSENLDAWENGYLSTFRSWFNAENRTFLGGRCTHLTIRALITFFTLLIVLPRTQYPIVVLLSLVCSMLSVQYFLTASLSNPGFVMIPSDLQYRYRHYNYCSVCNSPQPLRAVHCDICRGCVSQFHFHSESLCNCIGEKNVGHVLHWGCLQVLSDILILILCLLIFDTDKRPSFYYVHLIVWYGVVQQTFIFLFSLVLIYAMVDIAWLYQILAALSHGLTIEESLHWSKMTYMVDPMMRMNNPFDAGSIRANLFSKRGRDIPVFSIKDLSEDNWRPPFPDFMTK